MGLCHSTKAVEEDADKVAEHARAQRRRLSVSPDQVGDITQEQQQQLQQQQPAAGTQPASVVPDSKGDERAEAQGQDTIAVEFSKKGYVPYNRNKVNQDRWVLLETLFADHAGISMYGVMDGHGENGHEVAQFVKENLPQAFRKEGPQNLRRDPQNTILNAVKSTVAQLAQTNINCAFSGTTCVFGIKIDDKLYVANIGDSRCVVSHREGVGAICTPLSEDQKPDNPAEKARIIKAGGRVEPLPGPPGEDCGPHRVWLAEVDVPGLAMSRSIGDEVSQTVGVISIPEIKEHTIDFARDHFAAWASDGVWEFLSSEEVCQIVRNAIKKEAKIEDGVRGAAQALVEASVERWKKEEEVVDDITCVILLFKEKKN